MYIQVLTHLLRPGLGLFNCTGETSLYKQKQNFIFWSQIELAKHFYDLNCSFKELCKKLLFFVFNFFVFDYLAYKQMLPTSYILAEIVKKCIFPFCYFYRNNRPLCLCTAHYSITHNCTCYYKDPQTI